MSASRSSSGNLNPEKAKFQFKRSQTAKRRSKPKLSVVSQEIKEEPDSVSLNDASKEKISGEITRKKVAANPDHVIDIILPVGK